MTNCNSPGIYLLNDPSVRILKINHIILWILTNKARLILKTTLKSHFNVILVKEFKRNAIFTKKNHIIMLVKELGEAIKVRRKELGITQPHLAALAGISTNTLYKLERGLGNPSLTVILSIAEVLGMELKLDVKKL